MNTLALDHPIATLRYVDTTGNGAPDAFVATQVSQIGGPDVDGTVVRHIVETSVTGIDLDGVPEHIHITERLVAATGRGELHELHVRDLDVEPDDREAGPQFADVAGEVADAAWELGWDEDARAPG